MKIKLDRIISIATLIAAVAAIALVLKRPEPAAQPQPQVVVVDHSQPSDQKPSPSEQQPAVASAQSQPVQQTASNQAPQTPSPQVSAAQGSKAPNVNSDAISAMLAKSLGAGTSALTPDSEVGSGQPNIKDQQVTYDGDVVHGKFLTEIAGKDVWVTISGKMGEKDGYATFDPTEFKVGDKDVPVSLVNPFLQQRLAQERDRLKISDNGQK